MFYPLNMKLQSFSTADAKNLKYYPINLFLFLSISDIDVSGIPISEIILNRF
jgi:hypothetical protein